MSDIFVKRIPATLDEIVKFAKENEISDEGIALLSRTVQDLKYKLGKIIPNQLDEKFLKVIMFEHVDLHANKVSDKNLIVYLDQVFTENDFEDIIKTSHSMTIKLKVVRSAPFMAFRKYTEEGPIYTWLDDETGPFFVSLRYLEDIDDIYTGKNA